MRIAGIDEVGRGPLAGPVVAAVAVIDRSVAKRKLLRLIDDSKKLVLEDREEAYEAMIASGVVPLRRGRGERRGDRPINILQATFLAMRRALQAWPSQPDIVLIDGNRVPPELGCRAETIVGGDARSYSIAAASIFAKVTRDRYMAAGRGIPRLRLGDQCRLQVPGAFPGIEGAWAHPASSEELRAGPGLPRRALVGEPGPAEAIAEEMND